jgi:hypothetical protein
MKYWKSKDSSTKEGIFIYFIYLGIGTVRYKG